MIQLYEFQKQYLADMPDRAIMAADTGTGKTFMALAHYEKRAPGHKILGDSKHYSHIPLLILAPASKVRAGDWEREITEYFGEGNEPPYEIFSYEKFSRNPSLKQFKEGKRAIWHQFAPAYGGQQWAVIADECHRAKNPQSGIGKAVFQVARGAPFFLGLSATPMPNGWIDFANYSKIWDYTKGITEFKRRYCNIVDYKGFPEIRGYWREGELTEQWQGISRKLDKKQALDLPDRTFIGVDFKKPAEYNMTILTRKGPDDQLLDSPPLLAHALRQTLAKPKLDYLADLIDGTTENVVIFYNYISERKLILDMIDKKAKAKTLFRQDGERHELPAKEDWPDVKNSVTLAHYKSGSTGVEMTYATIVIYFSPTYSYADYVQSLGRVYRHGQTSKTTVYNFRTPSTIEEEVYDALRNKSDFQVRQWKGYEK